jgi:hypothetical protein
VNIIYVGDDMVDLYPDTKIALTVQKINIGDISGRSVNYTNSIDVPWTENNARIFGYSYDENSRSSVPYTLTECKIVQNGIEVLSRASLIVTDSKGRESFGISIYENVYNFFASVNNLNIADLDPIADSAWTAAGIDAARTNTSGIVAPFINWGHPSATYDANYFLPCFYYHTLISKILEYTGLTPSGDILTHSDFKDLVVPYCKESFKYPEMWVDDHRASGYNVGAISLSQVLTGTRLIPFDTVTYGANLNAATDQYTFTKYVNCTITTVIRVNAVTWNLATYLKVQIYKNGSQVAVYQLNSPSTDSGEQTITYTGDFATGDVVKMNIQSDQPSVPNGANCTVVAGWTFTFTPTVDVPRAMVNWQYLFPEISCKSLLSDFFNRFALIPKQVDNTLYLKSLEAICTDRANALDWSDKLVQTDANIAFDSKYAQSNLFRYSDTELVDQPELGQGDMAINNTALDVQRNIYTSIFGNTLAETFNTVSSSAKIPVYTIASTDIDEFINEPKLRLLTLKDRTVESPITFDATPRTDYKIAYFVDSTQTKDTGWEYFLGQYYPSLESSLQKSKTISKLYRLTELDIANYDPHKMIYDGYGYYIVNKILNFIPGRLTKVEVFKIN